LNSAPGSIEALRLSASPLKVTQLAEPLRPLRGRNKALLVKTDDERYFVQKFNSEEANDLDLLFNEAFASQLGSALDLPFPAWSELTGYSCDRRSSSFGSELISGDLLEYLPGAWHSNISNRADAYRCLLFDLWCNHTDSRQAVFQTQAPRVFHVYFFDHDQTFSPEDRSSLSKRIARARCLDPRIYKQPSDRFIQDLAQFADRITMLVQNGLHELAGGVPASWGSIDHREQALAGLARRSSHLGEYIEAIAQFASGLA
jgi:hypothetical protein